jgi:hypothetical protein
MDTNKKVAILLSGNLRNFDAEQSNIFKISEYYAEIAEKYNADVFCFTDDNNYIYNGETYLKKTYENTVDMGNHQPKTPIVFSDYETGCKNISNILLKTFGKHLKKYKIIPYISSFVPINISNSYHISFYKNESRPTSQKNNILNSCYKFKCAYNLLEEYEKETSIKYDIIIKSRFDCIPHDILNCIDIREIDYTNTLICGYWSGFLYDHAAIGNREIMHHYCNYYNIISLNLLDENHSKVYWGETGLDFGSNPRNYLDISDSMEYGLTYLIRKVHNYELKDYGINFRYFIPGFYLDTF